MAVQDVGQRFNVTAVGIVAASVISLTRPPNHQPQLAVVDHVVFGHPPRELAGLVPDDRHSVTLASLMSEHLTANVSPGADAAGGPAHPPECDHQPYRGHVVLWQTYRGPDHGYGTESRRDDIERNPFQQWVAELTTAAEKWAKMPYDVVSPKLGLTPNVHRLASLGHDPLLGLVFGVRDILSGSCTFIDKSGTWRVIDHPNHEGTRNPLEALVKVVVHGLSDVFTVRGLPPPFLAPFQLISTKSGFTLKEGGDTVSVRDVARYMYSNGYDLRHFVTMKISPAIAEIILSAYHGVRAYAAGTAPGEAGIADRLKREQMLALTHGLLASANVLKTALYGWNPMAINLAQFADARGHGAPA